MSHRLLAGMLASLALIAGGCGSGESESPEAETPSPSPTPGETTAVPTQSLATKPNEQTKAPKKAPSASAGLIGSTDPDERAQQIQSRINAQRNGGTQTSSQGDPFGVLPVEAKVKSSATQTGGGTTPTGGTEGQTVASLPPLPPITPQAASSVNETPPLFVPPNEAGLDRIISQLQTEGQSTGLSISGSPSGGGGSSSSPSRGGGSSSSPSGGGGPIASDPSRGSSSSSSSSGGGGSSSSSSGGGSPIASSPSGGDSPVASAPAPLEPPPPASLPQLPALPPTIGPALPPEEPVASLPPLDGGSVAELPPLPVEIGPAIPPAPVEPPAIAETITITGVVQVGNEIQVIVQLPGSSTGRYVKVGDLIADGRVRIKRVEGIQGSNPIVILEEEGAEYARAVGDVPMMAMEEPDRG